MVAASGCAAVLGIEQVDPNDGVQAGAGGLGGQGGDGGTAGLGGASGFGGRGGRGGFGGFDGKGGFGGKGGTAGNAGVGGTGGNTGGVGGTGGNTGGVGGTGGLGGLGGLGGTGGVGGVGGVVLPGAVLINEVHHNPPGTDHGCFIEIVGPPGTPLQGYELHFVATEAEHELFVFGPQHTIGLSGFFVVQQDNEVSVPSDTNFAIDSDTEPGENPNLFNSSNVLELYYFDERVDALSYSSGPSGICASGPAPEGDCAVGPRADPTDPSLSMGRNQSSTDTNVNRVDFRLAPPSPGRINNPPIGLP